MLSVATNVREQECSRYVLVMRVDGTSYERATAQILEWGSRRESKSVCIANVHMAMECYDDASFRAAVNSADLTTPDGMPLVWVLRKIGLRDQQRVCGPELTLQLCEAAAKQGLSVGFYGGSEDTIVNLCANLRKQYPSLEIAYSKSPPYRALTTEEDEADVLDINESGVRILFVGLGCPKQERWMAEHRGRINSVMLGVGAAFDIHAGKTRAAPAWMQKSGLEWFYRLLKEPGRLWKRYFKHNPRFIWLAGLQVLGLRRFDP